MTHPRLALGLGAILLATSLAACGSDGGGGCGKVQPCGGDIKGTWTVVDSCLNSASLMTQFTPLVGMMCPSAKISEAKLNGTGSFSFNPDMTYSGTSSTSGTVKFDVPQSCLSGFSCALITFAIQLQLSQIPVPAIQSVTCAGTAACVCTIVLTPMMINEAGTYRTVGSLVSTWPSTVAGIPQSRDYCVQRSTLHFMTIDRTTSTGPGEATITADIVAEKK